MDTTPTFKNCQIVLLNIYLPTYVPTYLTSFQTVSTKTMFKCFFKEQECGNVYSQPIQQHTAHPSSTTVSTGSFCNNTQNNTSKKIFEIQIAQRK